jgi:hypothetical protein
MAKRHLDSLKAKQKKQKILAVVLGVAFLGLLAFQGPKTWKRLHPPATAQRPSYDSAAATTTTGTPSLAAPTLGGSETPGSSTPTGSSLASSSAPVLADGQLTSFSRFASKDPFAQQLGEKSSGSSGSSSSPSGSAGSAGGGKSSSGGSASAPTPGTAVISVNGTLYTVAVGGDFPTASESDPSVVPTFHLISLTAHTAKISIVGGSYANGAPAVTLRENKPVTLMNTADGTRYKLILKPVGTAVPTSAAAPTSQTSTTSTTPTTVTVPPPSSP